MRKVYWAVFRCISNTYVLLIRCFNKIQDFKSFFHYRRCLLWGCHPIKDTLYLRLLPTEPAIDRYQSTYGHALGHAETCWHTETTQLYLLKKDTRIFTWVWGDSYSGYSYTEKTLYMFGCEQKNRYVHSAQKHEVWWYDDVEDNSESIKGIIMEDRR